jgi:hypothetical protein
MVMTAVGKKIKQGKDDMEMMWEEGVLVERVVRKGLTDKVILEQRLEGNEKVTHMGVWEIASKFKERPWEQENPCQICKKVRMAQAMKKKKNMKGADN